MGVNATSHLEPTHTDEVVEAVTQAHHRSDALEIRGAGSVLDRFPSGDAPVLSTARLTGVVDHAPADLTVTVRAGTRLDELRELLADHGQECPIEPIGDHGATVGGRIATGLAGPRQLGAGRVRDWLLRVRFVTGSGTLATAGGVTVKDVTGFDLCRLLTGSWGTLGVITEATLKLRPVPPDRTWYATDAPRHDVTAQLYRPAAVVSTTERTHVLLEDHPDDARAQADTAGLAPADPPALPASARAVVDPARLAALRAELAGLDLTVAIHDQLGLCHLDGPADALAAARVAAERHGGALLVLDPSSGLPVFGRGHAPTALATRVEAALDPDGVLAPWRWRR